MEESLMEVCRGSRSARITLPRWPTSRHCSGFSARSSVSSGVHGGLQRESRRQGGPAVGQYLGRDEHHGVRADRCDPAASDSRVLQTKTNQIVDSLEMASVKFLNAITERQLKPAAEPDRD
jgi:hypothetical protein